MGSTLRNTYAVRRKFLSTTSRLFADSLQLDEIGRNFEKGEVRLDSLNVFQVRNRLGSPWIATQARRQGFTSNLKMYSGSEMVISPPGAPSMAAYTGWHARVVETLPLLYRSSSDNALADLSR
jgi:hypothetical protein